MYRLYVALFLITLGCQQQVNNKPVANNNLISGVTYDDIDYIIGDYKINPKQQKISELVEVGGESWDGVTYQERTNLNYKTTSLIFLGNQITFKEYLPTGCDIETIEVLTSNQFSTVYKDKNKVYIYTFGRKYPPVDISPYTTINPYLYKDGNGDLWTLHDVNGGGAVGFGKIVTDEKIDGATYKNINGNYSYDKNGLYYIIPEADATTRKYVNRLTKICSSNGEDVNPFVTVNYLIYNHCVYSLKSGEPLKLDLNVNRIVEIKPEQDYNQSYLTDGKKAYKAINRYGYDSIPSRLKELKHQVLNEIFLSGLDLEYIFSDQLLFCQKNSSEVILINENKENCISEKGRLIKTSKGYYLLPTDSNYKTAKIIRKVLIVNGTTQKEEVIEMPKFKYLQKGDFIYKNNLYVRGGLVSTNLNLEKTRRITNNSEITNFITDGNLLYYTNNLVVVDKDFHGLNVENIKIVNENIIIVDDSLIVSKTSVTPIKSLGLNVKIFNAQ